MPVKVHAALLQGQMTHDAAHGAGFARPIAPDQSGHLSLLYRQGKAAQDLRRRDKHVHVFQFKHGRPLCLR